MSGLTLEEANMYESKCIQEHNSFYPNGYNLTTGGGNKKLSEETKKLIGEKSKGRPSANKGKSPSPETRQKMSLARRGKKNPKLSEAKRGSKQSADTIQKRVQHIRGIPRPEHVKQIASETHKGKIVSIETKQKQSLAKQGRKLSPESIIKRQATRLAKGLIKTSSLLPDIS